ncbi:MAG: hypothetical protein A3H64_00045 [Candidatus Ryanbacteria bacterium RIFCSPLOWO2_02_FULL_45_11c]|uniref:Uncharacterized protein n=1 Tax=Candidatus Ryanbacteria bacterium RIFCSPLOWO2_02_FULL_45_11c TaxID=1802128 RepID=A0A1G2GVS4_9BACT|nr:MAG: hypothetical protein A3H64_00045 [Candidatus Ryanbacteria bacterium RIFCSPLOWO2_02_FULL_45_11c]
MFINNTGGTCEEGFGKYMKQKLLPVLGIIICFAGGFVGILIVIGIYYLSGGFIQNPGGEGLGEGAILWGFLPGITSTYFLLKKYFPDFLGINEQKTIPRRILGWIGIIISIFLISIILAVFSFSQ